MSQQKEQQIQADKLKQIKEKTQNQDAKKAIDEKIKLIGKEVKK